MRSQAELKFSPRPEKHSGPLLVAGEWTLMTCQQPHVSILSKTKTNLLICSNSYFNFFFLLLNSQLWALKVSISIHLNYLNNVSMSLFRQCPQSLNLWLFYYYRYFILNKVSQNAYPGVKNNVKFTKSIKHYLSLIEHDFSFYCTQQCIQHSL